MAPKQSGQQLLRKGGTSGSARLSAATYFECLLLALTQGRQKVAEVAERECLGWASQVPIL
jgi:hypothetical protein